MQHSSEIDAETLEKCRAYLKLLATSHVDTWLQQRVDASDLVQQTLLDAVNRRDQYRGTTEGELLAWLQRILSNNLVDAFRHHHREKRDLDRVVSLEAEIRQSFRRLDALAVDTGSSPSQRAAVNEQVLRLPAALDQLPEAQKLAIIMHHLQEMTIVETAERLGRSESAVGGLLHRGLKRLNELLGD